MSAGVRATVKYGQRRAERVMTEQVVVRRPTETTSNDDGFTVTTYATLNPYEGIGKIQTFQPYEQTPDVGVSTVTVQRYTVHVPVWAGPFEVGDVAVFGERRFRIAGLNRKTHQTAQRLLADEVPAGGLEAGDG